MGPKTFSLALGDVAVQADDLLMGREGCAFKSHVPKVYGLTEGWKKLLTLH